MVDDQQGDGWPAITYETLPWRRSGDEVASRRTLRRVTDRYEAAVPPLIRDADVALESDTLAGADEASHALARFDAEAGAFIAPFPSILLRSESSSSSEVENLTAGAKQVALAAIGASRSANARLVVANAHAMDAALALSAELTEDAVIAMHRALLADSAPNAVGRWRDEQVWIGGGAISPHAADFVPPHHSRIPALMRDLLDFTDRTDVPVLAQAAIAHAQFETIHPFPDGNGRTGRALIHAMLRRGALTRNVTVPVSAGLLHSPQSYFEALTDYRAGDVDAIVHAITNATFAAIGNGRHLVREIQEARSRWSDAVRARADSSAHRLMDLLLAQPVITVKTASAALDVSEAAANTAVNRLAESGILTQTGGAARYRIWQAGDVIEALDAFADRARRGRV
ncbi:MAG TPA: Fic family protein [Microbacterium sp.]|nr:Fic family protein [Microbacterium sp.]